MSPVPEEDSGYDSLLVHSPPLVPGASSGRSSPADDTQAVEMWQFAVLAKLSQQFRVDGTLLQLDVSLYQWKYPGITPRILQVNHFLQQSFIEKESVIHPSPDRNVLVKISILVLLLKIAGHVTSEGEIKSLTVIEQFEKFI